MNIKLSDRVVLLDIISGIYKVHNVRTHEIVYALRFIKKIKSDSDPNKIEERDTILLFNGRNPGASRSSVSPKFAMEQYKVIDGPYSFQQFEPFFYQYRKQFQSRSTFSETNIVITEE